MSYREIEPPQELEGRILQSIRTYNRRNVIFRCIAASTVSLLSFISLIPLVTSLAKEIQTSGFYAYLSLAFSDNSLLLTYWKEFSLSLAESLPLFALLAVLAMFGLFLWSLSRATRTARLLTA